MVKRVLIAVGGTGGHIYPAIALAKKLKQENPEVYIMFAGGGLHDSRFFDRSQFPYDEISCGYFPLSKPLTLIKSLGKVASGLWQSDRVIKEFKPDLVVGFGSYHSLPILLSAKLHSIPIILHEGNAVPGKVNRLLAKHALFTGIQFPEAAEQINGKTIEVDAPLREGLHRGQEIKGQALEYFALDPQKKTLLVFGGSQGAFAINRLVSEAIKQFHSQLKEIQVVHLAGSSSEAESVTSIYQKVEITHYVTDFENEMGKAWAVADVVIGRSGAGTIAEAMEFEVPAILIPYPHAADDHQLKNAQFMVNKVGGAITLIEESLTPETLGQEILSLFADDTNRSSHMREAIKKFKENEKHQDFSTLVAELIP